MDNESVNKKELLEITQHVELLNKRGYMFGIGATSDGLLQMTYRQAEFNKMAKYVEELKRTNQDLRYVISPDDLIKETIKPPPKKSMGNIIKLDLVSRLRFN